MVGEWLLLLSARAVDSPESRAALFNEINSTAFDLMENGGVFGYPLVSTFAGQLYKLTGKDSGMDDPHVEIIRAHIDALRAVIKGRVKGVSGDVAGKLIADLESAVKKHAPAIQLAS